VRKKRKWSAVRNNGRTLRVLGSYLNENKDESMNDKKNI